MSTIDPHGSYPPPPPPPGGGGFVPPASPLPGEVANLKVFFLVSLIVNAIAALVWLLSVVGIGAATCGLGCLLIFIPVIPVVAVVFDAMALSKLGQAPNLATWSFLKTAAILDIVSGVLSGGLVPLVMGILALLQLQKPEVLRYFGGTPTTGF